MLNIGERVREYTLKRFLGSGTFGEVWLAEKELELSDEGILFALKFLHDKSADINSESIRSELNTWIKAGKHSNIVRVYDGFVHHRYLIIVSDYVEGGSLRDWLETNSRRAPSLIQAVEMMRGILRGLSHLHARRIIHRDLKPENILLDDGSPKITDFGVSRIVETFSSSAAQRWTGVAGSPAYMPPEAFSDGPPLPQGDIWSAGIIFYEMLSGSWPFQGQSMYALFAEIAGKEPRPLPHDVPTELRTITTTALLKDVNQRFQTAEKMMKALDGAWAEIQKRGNIASTIISTERFSRQVVGEIEILQELPSAETFFKRGNDFYAKKEYESALQNYDRALELNPQYPSAYLKRGNAYHMKGDYDQAFTDYNKAIALDPLLSYAYINRGNIYYEEGELDQAMIDYNRAIQVDPQCAIAYFKRGKFYASKYYDGGDERDAGDYDRAMRSFDKAIRFDPRFAETYNARGFLFNYRGNYDQAIMDYDKAIELNPKYTGAYINRGNTYRDKGNYEKAARDYDKAIELSPGNARAYEERAFSFERRGDYDRAIADYSKVIELDSADSNTYGRRGRLHEKKGDYDEALRDLNKVIELNAKDNFVYYRRSEIYKKLRKGAKTWAEWWEYRKRARADRKKYDKLLRDEYGDYSTSPVFPLAPF